MVVEEACTCDGLPAHIHLFRASLDPDPVRPDRSVVVMIQEPYEVRILVDWKAVVRDYALDERIDRLHGPGAAAAINRALDDGSIFSDNREP